MPGPGAREGILQKSGRRKLKKDNSRTAQEDKAQDADDGETRHHSAHRERNLPVKKFRQHRIPLLAISVVQRAGSRQRPERASTRGADATPLALVVKQVG